MGGASIAGGGGGRTIKILKFLECVYMNNLYIHDTLSPHYPCVQCEYYITSEIFMCESSGCLNILSEGFIYNFRIFGRQDFES